MIMFKVMITLWILSWIILGIWLLIDRSEVKGEELQRLREGVGDEQDCRLFEEQCDQEKSWREKGSKNLS